MPAHNHIDITGQRFGKLTAVKIAGRRLRHTMWECLCDCGNTAKLQLGNLRTGHTRSCGCGPERRLKSGVEGTRSSYRGMMRRCYSPKAAGYKYWGGKGIRVCKRWRKSFEAFLEDMGPRPPGMSIERENGEMNYKPSNCRWATRSEQNKNRNWHAR